MKDCAMCQRDFEPSEGENKYLCASCVKAADEEREWRNGMTFEKAVEKMKLRRQDGLEPGTGEIVTPDDLLEIFKETVIRGVTASASNDADALREFLWAQGLLKEYHTLGNRR